ncbi:MAG: molybdopterin-dependent oxidoreductase, partial [Candidatus Rokubacteria bacterium]|nr:molybdopterin-dependent oxidoreductase [Candidatus Rokubacteria bacterium]
LCAMKTGVPVKWIEDRREHLLASSTGTDRVAWRELAARQDGTILGMRMKWLDNVGGYIRSPEPGCSFRPTGNFVGPYRFQHLEVDASTVMTNKSLTGPNRGYACGHLYFETERMVDLLAEKLGLDPAEVRRRNLLKPEQFPYRTPTGGLYDSGDYPAAFAKALEVAKYDELRSEQARRRATGRYVGIGLAVAVDPSVSNMGYVATALDPQFRAKPEYLPKSGAVDACTVKIDPLGRVIAILATTPQGQGHQTIVSQIVADELGLTPEDVTVVDEMDTFTRVWSISSGTYSSRFGAVGTSAVALAARKLKAKLVEYAAHLMERPVDQVEFRDGAVRVKQGKGPFYTIKDLAGRAHWHTQSLPDGMEPGLQATAVFGFKVSEAVDAADRVNSSNTYGFIAEVMAVEVDPATAAITIL